MMGSRHARIVLRRIALRRTVLFAALWLAGLGWIALFGPALAASNGDADRPVLVELFTSQSCYSCPPAETHLADLARRDDLVALEWHVDYWDDLVYGRHGSWKDPYSDSAFTDRQRRYNAILRGHRGVYTPQMIVQGRYEGVGSQRREIARLIGKARDLPRASLSAVQEGETVRIVMSGASRPAALLTVVGYLPKRATRVKSGENHGKALENHNIVTRVAFFGALANGLEKTVAFRPETADDERCAVLVQDPDDFSVMAASYCRTPSES